MRKIKWGNLILLTIMVIFTGVLIHDLILILKGATLTSFGLITIMFMTATLIYGHFEFAEDVEKKKIKATKSSV